MKRILFLLLFGLIRPGVHAQDAYRWLWGTQPTVTAPQTYVASWAGPVTTDAADNLYFAARGVGYADGFQTYRPAISLGGVALAVNGFGTGIFRSTVGIAKLNAAGTYQWVVNLTNEDFYVQKLAVDAAGSVYVLGGAAARNSLTSTSYTFGSTSITFGPQPGLFVAKLSAGGQWLWATKVDTRNLFGEVYPVDLAVRSSGNTYTVNVLGRTTSSDCSFGTGSYSISYANGEVFVGRLNGTTGAWTGVWQGGSQLADAETKPTALALTPTGDALITGSYWRRSLATSCAFGTAQLPVTLLTGTANSATGLFVAKLTAAGAWQWAVGNVGSRIDGTSSTTAAVSIASDASGNAIVGGRMESAELLTLGTAPTLAWPGAFVARISSAGVWQWATGLGGTNAKDGFLVRVAPSGHVFGATTAGDLTIAGRNYPTLGAYDIAVVRFSSAGVPQSAVRLGGDRHDYVNGLALDSQGNPCVTGIYYSAGLPAVGLTHSSPYLSDQCGFLAKAVPAQVPAISSIAPASAVSGATITINGTGFYNVTGVTIMNAAATFTVNPTGTAITATVPSSAPGSGQVIVRTPMGNATAAFQVVALPTVSSFSPAFGVAGSTVVTISGSNFTGATSVRFNATTTTNFTVVDNNTLRVTVPAGASTGKVSVTNPVGTGISTANFGVGLPPTISAFTPTTGAVGTSFTISGTSLGGATSVRIGTATCTVTANTATSITATVPSAVVGAVNVTTPYGTATGGTFTPTAPQPSITSFTPASGAVGASVTVTGQNLNQLTGVQLNGVTAAVTAVTATSLTFTVPEASTGRITVMGTSSTATSATNFTVTAPTAPLWTRLTSLPGAGGTLVQTITGLGVDAAGNQYVCGTLNNPSTTVFTLADGTTATLAPQSAANSFVAKINGAGQWVWARLLGGAGAVSAVDLAVDSRGNVAVVGNFSATMSAGTATRTSLGGTDVFLARYDANGTLLTLEGGGSLGEDSGVAVALNATGTVYVGANLGVGATGWDAIAGFGNTWPAQSIYDNPGTMGTGCLMTYQPTTGWARGGRMSFGFGSQLRDLSVSPTNGNVVMIGTAPLTTGGAAVAMMQVLPDANFSQTVALASWDFAPSVQLQEVVHDGSGNYFVVGSFQGSLGISSTQTLTARGATDLVVYKYSGFTNLPIWANQAGGTVSGTGSVIEPKAAAADASGNLTVGGAYLNTPSFGAKALPAPTGAGAPRDIFVARIAAAGTWQWATSAGSTFTDAANALALDAVGNTYAGCLVAPGAAFGSLTSPASNVLVVGKVGSTALPLPTITSFTPTSGVVGTSVTITGTNLLGMQSVTFLGNTSNSVTVPDSMITAVSNTSITVKVPVGAATGKLRLLTGAGLATSTANFTVSAPTITGFSPASGPVGAVVSVIGTGLLGITEVRVGTTSTGTGGTVASFRSESATTLYVTVPPGAATGRLRIATSNGAPVSATNFTVTALPTLTSFSPATGPAGTTITITGTNFTGATSVTLNGVSLTYTVVSATSITATVPSGAGSGLLMVYTPGGTATSASSFTVTVSAPTITGFTPTSGGGGLNVTITGTNFTGATAVTFNNVASTTFTVNSATSISAVVPSTATTGLIRVTTPGGTGVSSTSFTVTAGGPAQVTSLAPASGAVGTSVVITGVNFTGASHVFFNGALATFTVNSATRITATVPALASTGAVSVSNAAGTGVSSVVFTVTAPVPPSISSFTPTSGAAGTTVTITGTNLSAVTAVNFNGTPAAISSTTATSVTTVVPNGATTGAINVTTGAGTTGSSTAFTVLGAATGWPQGISGLLDEEALAVATDAGGNVYAAGYFMDVAAFGPLMLTAAGGRDAFVVKYDAAGTPQWAKAIGGTGEERIKALTVDGSNLYVLGEYSTSFTYPTGFGPATLTNASAVTRGFVGQLSANSGGISLLTGWGGATSTSVSKLAYGSSTGYLYVGGACAGTTTFDASAGLSLTSAGGTDGVVAAYELSTGTWAWATRMGSPNYDSFGGLTLDATGNLYAVGGFAGTLSISGSATTLVSAGLNDVWAVRLVPATGALSWAKRTGNAAGDEVAWDVAATTANLAVLIAGTGTGTVGTTTVTPGSTNGWLAVGRISLTGTWAAGIAALPTTTSGAGLFPRRLAAASTGAATVTGILSLGGTFGSTALTASGTLYGDAFVARTTDAGTGWQWAQRLGGSGADTRGEAVVLNAAGDALLAGSLAFASLTQNGRTLNPVNRDGLVTRLTTPVAVPTVTSFTPSSGPTGTSVTITGTNFTNVSGVTFNNVAATFTVVSATSITTTVPNSATTGKVAVTTAGGTATSATSFTVTVPSGPPTISSFSPASGNAGTVVTINGTNLTGATAVRFNGTNAAAFTVVSSTKITATAPAGVSTGLLTLTTAGGVAVSATSFTATNGALPTISSFTPTSGPAGLVVTIAGTNFTGATAVTFNGAAAAAFTVMSATSILATVPATATTGKIGVTTAAGTATSSANFTRIAAPTITSFSPTSGPVGTIVTITGTNLTGATAVRFNGVTATTLTLVSATQVKATVPAGAATGAVQLTTPGGTVTGGTFSVTGVATRPLGPPAVATTTEVEAPQLIVWPVPVTDVLHLELTGHSGSGEPTAEVVNALGRIVAHLTFAAADDATRRTATVSVADLPAGLYWVRVPGAAAVRLLKQ